MKTNQDFENIIERLSKEASMPTLSFENNLRKKILKQNQGPLLKRMNKRLNNALFGIDGMPFNNFGILTAGVLVIGVFMAGVFVYNLNQNHTYIQQSSQLSAQETYTVLNNVIKNNPSSLLSVSTQNGLLLELIADGNSDDPTALSQTVMQQTTVSEITVPKEFNFFHVTYTSTVGPKASTCSNFSTDNTVIDTYTYENGSNGTSTRYFKSVTTNGDGSLRSIAITDNTGTILYQGGSYAVHIPAVEIKATDNVVVTPTLSADGVFGAQSTMNKVNLNGKTYYEVVMVQTADSVGVCSSGLANAQAQIVIVYRVDPDMDYQIIATSYYLDTISNNNLILRTENNSTIELMTSESALIKYFQLDSSIPVRNLQALNTTPVTTPTDAAISNLNESGIKILFDSEYPQIFTTYRDNLSIIKSLSTNQSYINDKAFYSETNWQRVLTNNGISNDRQVVVSYDQTNGSGNITATYSLIKSGASASVCGSEAEQIAITIDGVSYVANAVTSGTTTVCFNYNNWQYEVEFSGTLPENLIKDLRFNVLDVKDTNEQTQLSELIKAVI